MRFRYRAYMGGPDPLAGPGPPPEEAVAAARELRARLVAALAAPGRLPGDGRLELTELVGALTRYADGDRSVLDEVDVTALGPVLSRLVDGRAGEALARLDGADHELSPRELRRLGEVALRELQSPRRGTRGGGGAHRGGTAPGGEYTGASVSPDEDGDRALDAVATVREAALRRALPGEGDVALRAQDVRVAEEEPSEAAAVALLVDLSHSMAARSLHEAATRTALALCALVDAQRPRDRLRLVGFGERARELSPAALVAHDWRRVPGTNLHHALRLARAHLRRHGGLRPQVLVVTDGEPTAHVGEDGDVRFSWPPSPRTVELTVAELDAVLRAGAEVTFFLLSDEARLRDFRRLVERRRGVRVVHAGAADLGPLVLDRYPR